MYAAAYAGKAGGEPTAWRELMLAETWYSPEEAVAHLNASTSGR